MDIQQVKVTNMQSPNGNDVPNQFIIRIKSKDKDQVGFDMVYFQSYNTIIAVFDHKGNVKLDADRWDYSRTTSKYRNIFLNRTTAEVKANIKSGNYELVDLN